MIMQQSLFLFVGGDDKIMNILIGMAAFIIGSVFYSFLNTVIYRLPEKKAVIGGGCVCSRCGHDLYIKDRIPVLSWCFLRGKCRYCNEKIPARYVFIEILGGVTAALMNRHFGIGLHAVTMFLFFAVMTVITFIDIDTMEIPPVLNVCIFLIGIASIWTVGGISMADRIIGMLVISVPLYILALFGGFGGGDVKLMFAAGFLLGWKITVAGFFIGIIIGGVYAGYLLIKKLKGMKAEVAFGPFLCIGLAIAVLAGDKIIDVYISFLGF